MQFIELSHLNRQQFIELEALQQSIRQKHHHAPHLYWHILRKIRPYPCNILAYQAQKELLGFASRFLFHEGECEISLLIHPKYATSGLSKQLFYQLLPYIPTPNRQTLILSTPHGQGPLLAPEKNWELSEHTYRLQWQRLIKKPSPMASIEITKASLDDYTNYKHILETCFPNGSDIDQDIYHLLITTPSTQIYLLKKDHLIIGAVQINQENKWLRLSDMAILPAHQGQGYGKYLLLHVLHLIQLRQKPICLDVESSNSKVYEWYLRLGFKPINTTDFWRISFKEIS